MAKVQAAEQPRAAVNVSLNVELLTRLDEGAARAEVTRSELIRRFIEFGLEQEAEDRWLAEEAEAALADPANQERIPLAQVKRELGL